MKKSRSYVLGVRAANMKYLEKAEGYKFFTIKDKLVSRLLNKDLIEESEFPQYAELLKNYEAEFTYDDGKAPQNA